MEIQDYCSSSSLDIQMEKMVVKLGTNPVPFCGRAATQPVSPIGNCFYCHVLVKSILLPPPQNIFGIHRLAYHFVPPLFSNISMAFCLGTGALESSPWSTRPLLS